MLIFLYIYLYLYIYVIIPQILCKDYIIYVVSLPASTTQRSRFMNVTCQMCIFHVMMIDWQSIITRLVSVEPAVYFKCERWDQLSRLLMHGVISCFRLFYTPIFPSTLNQYTYFCVRLPRCLCARVSARNVTVRAILQL